MSDLPDRLQAEALIFEEAAEVVADGEEAEDHQGRIAWLSLVSSLMREAAERLRENEEENYGLGQSNAILAMALNGIHDHHCGCDRPGGPGCIAIPVEKFVALAVETEVGT